MHNNNEGFSLVELIVTIAIMAVLVGVMAPQFMKYVEGTRRSNDVATAELIRQAILADISDGVITDDVDKVEFIGGNTDRDTVSNNPGQYSTTVTETPTINGHTSVTDTHFKVSCNITDGTCEVYAGDFCLTTVDGASLYKAGGDA